METVLLSRPATHAIQAFVSMPMQAGRAAAKVVALINTQELRLDVLVLVVWLILIVVLARVLVCAIVVTKIGTQMEPVFNVMVALLESIL